MNTATNQTTLTATLATSRYGNLQPQIEVSVAKGAAPRALRVALHEVAARVEAASGSEKWLVNIADNETVGWVYLELLEATKSEAERAMAVLTRALAGLDRRARIAGAPAHQRW
jgi:hypothetical protein